MFDIYIICLLLSLIDGKLLIRRLIDCCLEGLVLILSSTTIFKHHDIIESEYCVTSMNLFFSLQ